MQTDVRMYIMFGVSAGVVLCTFAVYGMLLQWQQGC